MLDIVKLIVKIAFGCLLIAGCGPSGGGTPSSVSEAHMENNTSTETGTETGTETDVLDSQDTTDTTTSLHTTSNGYSPIISDINSAPSNGNNLLSNSDWMQNTFASQPYTKLVDIYFPGTHNSGTYNISDSSSKAPGASGFYGYPFAVNVVSQWSRCQTGNITTQLTDGIRYLDLRIAYDGTNVNIVHGLVSIKFQNALDQIHTFATDHPREIILLKIVPDDDYKNSASLSDLSKMDVKKKQMLDTTFGTIYMPQNNNLKIQDIWGEKKSIILLDNFQDMWANVQSADALKAYFDRNLQSNPNTAFSTVQLILTPDKNTILSWMAKHPLDTAATLGKGVLTGAGDVVSSISSFFLTDSFSNSLSQYSQPVLSQASNWLTSWVSSGKKFNIVIIDFYEQSNFVATIQSLNSTTPPLTTITPSATPSDSIPDFNSP